MIRSSMPFQNTVTLCKVYPPEEVEEVDFLFNLETIQAYNFFDNI